MRPYNPQGDVERFMEIGGQEGPCRPTIPSQPLATFRCLLIDEEYGELVRALGLTMDLLPDPDGEVNMVKAADAIGDLLYVVYGTAVALGIDAEPIFNLVHAANMRKYPNGVVIRNEAGKVQKPVGWIGPEGDIAIELDRQLMEVRHQRGTSLADHARALRDAPYMGRD